MSDLISRQAAIELCDWYEHEFIECHYVIKALADDLKGLPSAAPEAHVIKLREDIDKDAFLEAWKDTTFLPPENDRWIPVTERLPDKGGDYLVSKTFHYGKLTQRFIMVAVYALNLREVDRYTFREDRPGWYDIDSEYGAYEVDNITAWLPLPDPYREEEE